MKNPWIIMLSLLLCIFMLCSCGKSNAVQVADELILKIGTVTLNSEQLINDAEFAVESLSAEEYNQLEHISDLKAAKETFQDLQYQKSAKEIETAINNIGEVTLYSNKDIKQICFWIDSVDDNVKQYIHNLSVLEEAKNTLFHLRIKNVSDLINQIGTVTLSSLDTITKANIAYGELSEEERTYIKNYNCITEAFEKLSNLKIQTAIDAINEIGEVTEDSYGKICYAKDVLDTLSYDEKQKVSNLSSLNDASNRFKEIMAEAKEKALSELKSNMKSKVDKVQGITWYLPVEYPDYIDERCFILPYIGEKSYSNFLRVKINYTGDRWVFFDNIIISIDGENYYKKFNYYDIHRDNDTEVWENIDFAPDGKDIQILRDIVNSNETIIRFQGKDRYYDFTVSESDKSAIEYVLSVYEKLK